MKQEAGVQTGKRAVRVYSAKEKARAVLAVWSARRNPAALSKELGVSWTVINSWEKRALSGMLTALDPTWKRVAEERPSLPPRVEKLMEQTLKPAVEPVGN